MGKLDSHQHSEHNLNINFFVDYHVLLLTDTYIIFGVSRVKYLSEISLLRFGLYDRYQTLWADIVNFKIVIKSWQKSPNE